MQTQNLLISVLLVAAVAIGAVALLTMDPSGRNGPRTGTRYVEQARAAAAIDPARIGWQEAVTPRQVAMDKPRALAVAADGRVYVIGDRLVILDAAGAPVLRSEPLPAGYRAIAVAPDGRCVAAARRHVDVLAIRGAEVQVERRVDIPGEQVYLTAVAAAQTAIFAADAGGCRVCRIPWEAPGDGAPFQVLADGFFVPSTMELAVSPQGELTTVDPGRHKVQVRDDRGEVRAFFGKQGGDLVDFHGCCNPIAIAVMADRRVVTAEKGIATTRVKVYDRDGVLDSVVAGPQHFDHRPDGPPILLDVAVDSQGRILVLDPSRQQVRVFTRRSK